MKRSSCLSVAMIAVVLVCVSSARAASGPYKLCSTGQGNPIVSPGKGGKCGNKQHALSVASDAEVASLRSRVATLEAKVKTLQTTLTGVSRVGNTLFFNHMNLQLVSGASATDAPVNGLGNLIIGYNESPGTQTGSHNLVLGKGQTFTSYGGIISGLDNTLSGPLSAVFGYLNTAKGSLSSVAGGEDNHANGYLSTVNDGLTNTTSGDYSSVSAGNLNTASGERSSVTGGVDNTASGEGASVSGGDNNTSSGFRTLERGGFQQTISADYAYGP